MRLVQAIELFDIDLRTAEEFHEIYKGVVPEYKVSMHAVNASHHPHPRFVALTGND